MRLNIQCGLCRNVRFLFLLVLPFLWSRGSSSIGFANDLEAAESLPKRDVEHRGASPGTSLEWWYLTGPLWTDSTCDPKTGFPVEMSRSEQGRLPQPDWGFQMTFFHSGQSQQRGLLFHGAISKIDESLHDTWKLAEPWQTDRTEGLLGGARVEDLDLRMGPQFLNRVIDGSSHLDSSVWWARLSTSRFDVRLSLEIPDNQLWKHGDAGKVEKIPGQSNWYVSHPLIRARGHVRDKQGGLTRSVCGSLWFDHEIDVGVAQELSWKWFSIRFPDGNAYMFYEIWKEDSAVRGASQSMAQEATKGQAVRPLASFGEKFDRNTGVSIPISQVNIVSKEEVCLKSGGCYPQRFEIYFDAGGKKQVFYLQNIFPEQEVYDPLVRSYWEGLARVEDEFGRQGLAFIEMTRHRENPKKP